MTTARDVTRALAQVAAARTALDRATAILTAIDARSGRRDPSVRNPRSLTDQESAALDDDPPDAHRSPRRPQA